MSRKSQKVLNARAQDREKELKKLATDNLKLCKTLQNVVSMNLLFAQKFGNIFNHFKIFIQRERLPTFHGNIN